MKDDNFNKLLFIINENRIEFIQSKIEESDTTIELCDSVLALNRKVLIFSLLTMINISITLYLHLI